MDQEDRDRLCRVEMSVESLHEKIDALILPACADHTKRITRIENAMQFGGGVFFVLGGVAILAKDILIEWVKTRMSR